jgi:fructose transport system permease protein
MAPNAAASLNRGTVSIGRAIATPAVGPLVVLLVFCAIFSLSTHTFFAVGNLSLVIQQSVIVGTLAIGQTMVILTGGIDLANGAVAVLGTIVAGRMVNDAHNPVFCLLLAIFLCTLVGTLAGLLVSRLMLPPFIVTLGLLGIVPASTRLIAQGGAFRVTDDLLGWTGNSFIVDGTPTRHAVMVAFMRWSGTCSPRQPGVTHLCNQNNRLAARLVGIPVQNRLLSVYMFAAFLYGSAPGSHLAGS